MDWTLILINTPISLYLYKPGLINLSLVSKLIRSKLTSLIFKNLTINDIVLFNQPNYFMNKKILGLGNFGYLANIWIIGKNGFNRELAFKEARIDSFINQVNGQLKSRAKYCKSVSFECLGKACYFILPIMLEFINLRTLSFGLCIISLTQLNSILSKLEKLQILELIGVKLVTSTDSSSAKSIAFPQSLLSLTYINSISGATNLPLEKPLQFLTDIDIFYNPSIHPLLPLKVPKLHKLNYISRTIDEGLIEFLEANCQIENLSLRINLLLSIQPNQGLLTNLKKLKLYPPSFRAEQLNTNNSNIPAFPNLEELSLNLVNNTELEFSHKLIKKCPKLFRLDVYSGQLEYNKLRELTKFAKNLNYFNEERLYRLGE